MRLLFTHLPCISTCGQTPAYTECAYTRYCAIPVDFLFINFFKKSIPKRQLLFTSQFESMTHLCLTSQASEQLQVRVLKYSKANGWENRDFSRLGNLLYRDWRLVLMNCLNCSSIIVDLPLQKVNSITAPLHPHFTFSPNAFSIRNCHSYRS